MASCSEVVISDDKSILPENVVTVVTEGAEISLPLGDLVDREKELDRLAKEREKQLRDKRDDLELRMRKLFDTIERADHIVNQVNVVINYLTSDLKNVSLALEQAKIKQDFGIRIIAAQEEERKRLSREIHDGPAQMMANVLMRSNLIDRTYREKGVEAALAERTGKIASIIGRYYAMDRDKRWERVKVAYDLLVNGVGEAATDMVEAMQRSYDEGVTDEFVKPIVRIDENGEVIGRIKPNDLVIFYNYRNDRAKEITIVLTQQDMPEEGMHTMPLYYCCMTPYDAKFEGLHILFDKDNVPNTIGEYIAAQGLKQLRIAETEKYAHVTFFLNGGREDKFAEEDRILVASPKVATYDLQPEMSAYEVKDKLVEALGEQKYDFICLNFANGDMVGHTGVYEAIEKAVKAVDECVKDVVEAAKANGYEVVQIADHGNADNAVNPDGTPNTAHSLNPVPIVVVSDRVAKVKDGILADVAPTVLDLMGLPKPTEMTGESLVEYK